MRKSKKPEKEVTAERHREFVLTPKGETMELLRKEDTSKLIQQRHFLILLRESARDFEVSPGISESWAQAYADLARAADRLDAMHARATVPDVADSPAQSLFKILRKAAERAWIIEVNVASPKEPKEEWIKKWMQAQLGDIRERALTSEAVASAKLSKSQKRRLDVQRFPMLGKARVVIAGGDGKTVVGDIN